MKQRDWDIRNSYILENYDVDGEIQLISGYDDGYKKGGIKRRTEDMPEPYYTMMVKRWPGSSNIDRRYKIKALVRTKLKTMLKLYLKGYCKIVGRGIRKRAT